MAEPTSVLTFRDLIIEVARKIGIAYYGDDGTEVAQVPNDAHDLDECRRHVNNAIRMFVNDGPNPNGWRWLRPVGSFTIWGTINADSSKTVTSAGYDPLTEKTTLVANVDSFYSTMEEHTIGVTGVDSFTISNVVDAKTIKVRGDATAVGTAGETWSITSTGNFTMPRDFSGQFVGTITYEADTNQGVSLDWADESTIRLWRENIEDETGDPFWAAIRPFTTPGNRRRWELLVYPQPDEVMVVEFPYHLHFDRLVDLDEVPPTPFAHDEAIKAACLAVVEKDVEGAPGVDWNYYSGQALPNSLRVDAQSAPKRLGYFGNPGARGNPDIKEFRANWYQRPDVRFNT